MSVYHYTTEEGAKAIEESGVLNPSTDTTNDALYGKGVYCTSMPPDKATAVIERNNYDGMRVPADRVRYVVEIPKDSFPAEKIDTPDGRDIYMVKGEDPVPLPEGTKIYPRESYGK